MHYIQYLYQYNHRLQCKVAKTRMTSFRTHDFNRRYRLDAGLNWTASSTYTLNTVQNTISSVAILRWSRFVCLNSDGTDGPSHVVWGDSAISTSEVIMAATSTRRFPQPSILIECQIPHNVNLPRDPMLFPVRGCPRWSPHEPQAVPCSTPWGGSRVMTKCNGRKIKQNSQYRPKSPQTVATQHRCLAVLY